VDRNARIHATRQIYVSLSYPVKSASE
jgi:hypothetical protein